MLRFSVRDTGIGIPADKAGLLFDKFSQVDASTTRRYGGTGLGLAISKEIVALMDGRIGVSSEVGQFSEFWFTARFATRPEPAAPHAPARSDGLRVLIVDHHTTASEARHDRLARWGLRPTSTGDLPAALAELRRAGASGDPYRFVLVDERTAGLDTATLTAAALPGERPLVVTMGTAIGDGDGARYLTKPLHGRDLRSVLFEGGAGPNPSTAPAPFAGREVRVLLADDNATNRLVGRGVLEKLGVPVDTVSNGQEAVTALERTRYDLVLMDVQMPVLDGLEATRLIRGQGMEIPIIALTSYAMPGDDERCRRAGMNHHLTKPIDASALRVALDLWLPEPGANPPARAGAGQPGWDRTRLVERLLGDGMLADAVLREFLRDLPTRIHAVVGLLASGDIDEARNQAHAIRGAAANVEARAVHTAALGVENAATAEDARPHLVQLERAFKHLVDAVRPESLVA
jgi:CheY-like chemotaxis protein